jgi:hypothetical protein
LPISREEFESKLDRPVLLVLEFLRSNMDNAYTSTEVTSELYEVDDQLTDATVQRALDELVVRERAETSVRDGEVYYAYRRWLGLRPR